MSRFLFKYYYIGLGKYYGSQRQKNVLTVESRVIDTLKERKYIRDPQTSNFESASRTDRYVSARGAVFAIDSLKNPILMELNAHLPNEIGIWAYTKVPKTFSPRFNAKMRHYRYIIPWPFSFLKQNYDVDLKVLKNTCKKLEGVHDFQNFSKRDSKINNTERHMETVKVHLTNDTIIIDFKSKAFLRQQIRRIAKKLIEIITGEISIAEFKKLFNSSKFESYQPANPKGLILWDIEYDNEIVKFEMDRKSLERMRTFLFHRKMESFLQYNLFSLVL